MYYELQSEGRPVLLVGSQEKSASIYGSRIQPNLDVTKYISSAEAVKKKKRWQQDTTEEVQLVKTPNCILVEKEKVCWWNTLQHIGELPWSNWHSCKLSFHGLLWTPNCTWKLDWIQGGKKEPKTPQTKPELGSGCYA